jgi:hypothetical protein
LHNGERFIGKVVSLNNETVVIESDVLGSLRLPRTKVAAISFAGANDPQPQVSNHGVSGTNSATNSLARPQAVSPQLSSALRRLGTNTLQQVRGQFLASAGPEANNKFNELLGGLLDGTLTVHDIRVQARSAADQIRELKNDSGEQSGWALDGYLAILEHFLNEPDAAGAGSPNASAPGRRSKAESPTKANPKANPKAEPLIDSDN